MNILLMPVGTAGDVFPYVSLAEELQRRGHHILFAASGNFRSLAARHGLTYVELMTQQEYDAAVGDDRLWQPKMGAIVFAREFILKLMRRQCELVQSLIDEYDVSLMMAPCHAIGARIAHDKFELPLATVHLAPYMFRSEFKNRMVAGLKFSHSMPRLLKRSLFRLGDVLGDGLFGKQVNGFRNELGLPPVRKIFWHWWNSPQFNLALFPSWFAEPQPDWPSSTRTTHFVTYGGDDTELSDDLASFIQQDDKRPIAFTPGTGMAHGKDFFKAAVEACQRLRRRGILLTRYKDQIPDSLPASIKHVDFAPFDKLLPELAAFVHHGGVGTMAQTMLAGIPQVTMPMGFDQLDNSDRVEKLGVGSYLMPKSFHGAPLAEKLSSLIESETTQARCREVRRRTAAIDGTLVACDAIEERFGTYATATRVLEDARLIN